MAQSEPNSPTTPASPSLKQKRYSLCLPSPFRKHHNHHHNHSNGDHDTDSPTALMSRSSEKPKLVRTSSLWIKSRAHEIPELKDKCRNFISRIGRHGHCHGSGRGHHRRRHSIASEFHYDAFSYSLNFDDGGDEDGVDGFQGRSFSSRLPPSPSPSSKEIACN
ncbi:hypothetical protein K2173_020719 [Erythroxylum novogranatense]|uniref:Uncharacterized protein n=1 Tax=Erythroxylum novogranatense TaxID=1862640 RepID=A0AAV8TNY6_9ROSI|nr:hypothetical protein K2173_020719 [Erythroxylum novogranatense]